MEAKIAKFAHNPGHDHPPAQMPDQPYAADLSTSARAAEARRKDNAQRSALSSVKSAREQLAQTAQYAPEFMSAQMQMFVRNELTASIAIPLLAVCVALSMLLWAPFPHVVMWLSIVFIAKGIVLFFCRQYLTEADDVSRVQHWRNRLTAAEFLYGVAWASVAMLAVKSPDQAVHVFVFAVLITILSIRIMFASTVMPIVYVGTIPMTIALVVRCLLLGSSFYYGMAAVTVFVHLYFIFLARGLNSNVTAMLEFRAEKDLLIAEIEAEKSISDEGRHRAEAANVAKSRFLATMSHELRTPLNAILGFSEVMRDEVMGPMENKVYMEYAGNIHDSGAHLLKLINEILDISRIEAGKYDLHEEAVRLGDIVEECNRLLKVRIDGKKLNVVHTFTTEDQNIWADERAIRQIFLNLMSNALKFTPHGGTIEVCINARPGGGVQLSVNDSGPGIPEGEIATVLTPFGQGSLAHENAEGGTGLGLPIVQKLMQLHGGEFELTSQLRVGTQATITFPPNRVLSAVPQFPADAAPPQPLPQNPTFKVPPAPITPPPPTQKQHPGADLNGQQTMAEFRNRMRQPHLKQTA